MSQTSTPSETSTGAATTGPVHPADILLNLLIRLLAPMFLAAAEGDVALARIGAHDAIKTFQARNQIELFAAAQVIASTLASVSSLSRSMDDGLPVSMALRLRGNANALNRVVEQNRRAIRQSQANALEGSGLNPPQADAMSAEDIQFEADVIASVARTQERAAKAQLLTAPPQTPQAETPQAGIPSAPIPPAPAPIPVATTEPAPVASPAPSPEAAPTPPPARSIGLPFPTQPMTRQQQSIWGRGMSEIAAEYTASLPNLPPVERRAASLRAAILSSTANSLLCGPVPTHPQPGPWSAIAHPK